MSQKVPRLGTNHCSLRIREINASHLFVGSGKMRKCLCGNPVRDHPMSMDNPNGMYD